MFLKNIHHIGLNYVSAERLDPLIYGFLSLLGLQQSQFLYVALQLLVLASGMSVLLLITRAKGSFLAGAWSALALVLIFSFDPFLLKFHWLPWLLTAYVVLLLHRSLRSSCLAFLLSLLWIFSAGNIALLGILIAAASSIVISLKMRSFTAVLASGTPCYARFAGLVATSCLLALYATPSYPMPDYPSNARLTQESVFDLVPFPIIGQRLHPIPIVEPVFQGLLALYFQNYIFILLSLGIGMGLGAVLWRESVQKGFIQILLHVAVMSLFCFSFLYWPAEKIAQQPFILLMRIVPGLGYALLPWLLLPFSIILLSVAVFAHCSRRIILSVLLSTSLTAALLFFSGSYAPTQAHFRDFAVAQSGEHYAGVTWSPSASVVATIGAWSAAPQAASQRSWDTLKRLFPGREYRIREVEASINQEAANRAIDTSVFTSWSTVRNQAAGDFYEIRFEEAVAVARIALSIQETPRYWPCSIELVVSDEAGVSQQVYYQDPWPGPVFWSTDGFPYFGQKQHVVIDLATSQRIVSARFRILNGSCQHPWSIGEVKLYNIAKENG